MKFIKTILMVGLLAPCCAWQQVAAQGLAFTTNAFIVGVAPTFVVATDVNGDGKIDLISANFGSARSGHTLTVLTNNSNGVFGSNATLNVDNGPICVAAADINGDGSVDLISANESANTLTILTNNGSGVFGSNATITVGSSPICVVAVDINNDSNVDLICANLLSSTLTVLTNNGNGVFGSNATLNVGSGAGCIVAADVNGDGKPDLICAITTTFVTGNTLLVLTNNGSGVFGSNATLNVGSGSGCVIATDINGDGKLDLISADLNANTLTVLTNNGSGVFGSNATLNVGTQPNCVVAADINGDGKPDLISANFAPGGTLTVLTNNGNGVFSFNATLNVDSGPECVAAADINGDGKLDLISANLGFYQDGKTLTVLMNETVFPPPTLNIVSTNSNSVVVSWSSPLTGFVLQTNSDLATTNWGLSNYLIATNGALKSVIYSLPASRNLFFRLKQ